MTPAQVQIVKRSFAAVAPRREALARAFFAHLFDIDPTFRFLFRGDLRREGGRLVNALGLMVDGLDRLHVFVPALEALAVRHVGYGIEESHYRTVGEALIRTAADVLGESFTEEVEAAWRAAYRRLTGTMIAAARHELPMAA